MSGIEIDTAKNQSGKNARFYKDVFPHFFGLLNRFYFKLHCKAIVSYFQYLNLEERPGLHRAISREAKKVMQLTKYGSLFTIAKGITV